MEADLLALGFPNSLNTPCPLCPKTKTSPRETRECCPDNVHRCKALNGRTLDRIDMWESCNETKRACLHSGDESHQSQCRTVIKLLIPRITEHIIGRFDPMVEESHIALRVMRFKSEKRGS